MTALQVGYEAFENRRRRVVTFICLILASSSAMGISIYIDSYSVYEWDRFTQVGPVAMTIEGTNALSLLGEIRDLPGVTAVDSIKKSYVGLSALELPNGSITWYDYITVSALSPTLMSTFPTLFEIDMGRLPQNTSEITLNSELANLYELSVGSRVNCTVYFGISSSFVLTVVGIFHESVVWRFGYYTSELAQYGVLGAGIIHPQFPSLYVFDDILFLDVDRTPVTPFDPYGAMLHLLSIEDSIYKLRANSYIYVDDRLGLGVNLYISFVNGLRINEGLRAAGLGVLIVLVSLMAIRFNSNERRYEMQLLLSRGTPLNKLKDAVFKEILLLSVLSSLIGLPIGIILSRFGLVYEESYDIFVAMQKPFLISAISIILALTVGILLPLLTYIFYDIYISTRKRVEASRGRLAKFVRMLDILKWDVVVVLFSILFLLYVNSILTDIRSNPVIRYLLGPIMVGMPLTLLLGVGSLLIKILRRTADSLSNVLVNILGPIHSYIGVRRIGKAASSVAPVAIVIVLSISLTLGSIAVTESAPATKLVEARYVIGGDIRFTLKPSAMALWDDFRANVSSHPEVEATALVSEWEVMLSTQTYDYAHLVSLSPLEYIHVGYDHNGIPLNASSLREHIISLAIEPTGALVTRDIADTYSLDVGDNIRMMIDDDTTLLARIVGIPDFLPSMSESDSGTDMQGWWISKILGRSVIWVNSEFMQEMISESHSIFLCARTRSGSNSTQVAQEIVGTNEDSLIHYDRWVDTSAELDYYTRRTEYMVDRAVDMLLCVFSIFAVFVAYILYTFEGIQARRREIALLRAMGGTSSLVSRLQSAEMLVLAGLSLLLLIVVTPFIIISTVSLYHTSYYVFPVTYFLVLPWSSVATVVGMFVVAVIAFVVCVASLSSRVNLAQVLNADWTESSPFGGEV